MKFQFYRMIMADEKVDLCILKYGYSREKKTNKHSRETSTKGLEHTVLLYHEMYLQDQIVSPLDQVNVTYKSLIASIFLLSNSRPLYNQDLSTSYHDIETTEALNKSSRSRYEKTFFATDLGCFTASPKKEDLGSTIGDFFFRRRLEVFLASAIID